MLACLLVLRISRKSRGRGQGTREVIEMHRSGHFLQSDVLLAPRVGLAVAGIGMTAAFLAGAITVLVLTSGRATSPAVGSIHGVSSQQVRSVQDFGTPLGSVPREGSDRTASITVVGSGAAVAAPRMVATDPNVDDYGTPPRALRGDSREDTRWIEADALDQRALAEAKALAASGHAVRWIEADALDQRALAEAKALAASEKPAGSR